MTTDWVRLSTLLDDDDLLPKAVALAATDAVAYFAEHEEVLKLTGSTSATDVNPWTALLDGLDDAGALAYLDANDTGMEVSEAMSELPRIKEIGADLTAISDIDDLDEAIAHVDAILAPHGLRVICLTEDSDAYPLVVIPISHSAEVSQLAQESGHETRTFSEVS